MNLETLDLLSTKVEKALDTIRQLKSDKLRLEEQLSSLAETNKRLRAELDEKDHASALLAKDLEKRNAELQMLHDSLQDRDVKIQLAADRLENVMATLERELGTTLDLGDSTQVPASTVSAMSAEQAASLFDPAEETIAPNAPAYPKEEQASFFDYGGTNP